MDEINKWLEQTSFRATALSEAYRIRLDYLWWANLMFVVLPAIFSTCAAIFAALPNGKEHTFFSMPVASLLAGGAAVLTAVHKALKCEEYQTECLRLSQAFQSLAIAAEAALAGTIEERVVEQKRLAGELENLTKNAKAQVSTNFMTSTTI